MTAHFKHRSHDDCQQQIDAIAEEIRAAELAARERALEEAAMTACAMASFYLKRSRDIEAQSATSTAAAIRALKGSETK